MKAYTMWQWRYKVWSNPFANLEIDYRYGYHETDEIHDLFLYQEEQI